MSCQFSGSPQHSLRAFFTASMICCACLKAEPCLENMVDEKVGQCGILLLKCQGCFVIMPGSFPVFVMSQFNLTQLLHPSSSGGSWLLEIARVYNGLVLCQTTRQWWILNYIPEHKQSCSQLYSISKTGLNQQPLHP